MSELKFKVVYMDSLLQTRIEPVISLIIGKGCRSYSGIHTFKQGAIIIQWTGKQDKNGKDIYESDVIADDDGIEFTIKFRDGMFYCDEGSYFSTKSAIGNHGMQYYEVIGNIHKEIK